MAVYCLAGAEYNSIFSWVLWSAVIPAKAGIHSINLWKCAVGGLDSRFRGNDRRLEWIPIPNDTSTFGCSTFSCLQYDSFVIPSIPVRTDKGPRGSSATPADG